MPRILLVKTSSLGDVVHNLPVVSDILNHFPNAQIDWVVEESFAAIARMHPSVRRVIPVAIRRWRRNLLRAETCAEWRTFLGSLRAHEYDAVLDTQGLLKSALVTYAARGLRHGLDWKSSREPLWIFYNRTHAVSWGQHAVARNRSLVAQALGYPLAAPADYGTARPKNCADDVSNPGFTWLPAARYVVFLHATSASAKLWPERHWIELANHLLLDKIISILPWGSADERERSERLAAAMSAAVVPPALSLQQLAALLQNARTVVGVDTGLTHLAAALQVPTVGIYCATDPAATGIYACPLGANLGGIGAPPGVQEVIEAIERMVQLRRAGR